MRVYQQMKQFFIDHFESENNVFGVGTLDCWTNNYKRSYIGIDNGISDK